MGMYVDVVADGSLEEVALLFLVQSSLTVVGALVHWCSDALTRTTVLLYHTNGCFILQSVAFAPAPLTFCLGRVFEFCH